MPNLLKNNSDNYLIEMKEVSKEFFGVIALKNVNFFVKKGEVRALIGENGAGKSTLVKILCGVFQRNEYAGNIFINNEEILINSIIDAEKYKIAMISQENEIEPDLSAGENIFLNNEATRFGIINWDKLYSSSNDALKKINLEINTRELLKNFSPAIQRMVNIAKALSKDANILVLDEPTAALTEEEIVILFKVLKELKNKGVTIIFISHKLSELFMICDSVSVMRDGEMITTKEINDIKTENIVEMMTGRKIGTMYPKENIPIGEKILEIKNFSVLNSKTHREFIKDVNLYVKKGEILGVFGLIGSGRTELFSAVYGLIQKNCYMGDVFVNNIKITIEHPSDAIQNGIGLITEERKVGLFSDFSVNFNISIANLRNLLAAKLVIDSNKESILSKEYINKLNIKISSLNQLVKQLSGGNQQKVLLARWLVKELSILILDEPTRGIDIGAKVEIYKLMNEMTSRGMGLIFISSELPEILGMSDRIIVVHRGLIVGEFKKSEATERKILNVATGGQLN